MNVTCVTCVTCVTFTDIAVVRTEIIGNTQGLCNLCFCFVCFIGISAESNAGNPIPGDLAGRVYSGPRH